MRGWVALDTDEGPGLILSSEPVTTEKDGKEVLAWVGVSLDPATVGKFWRSVSPKPHYRAYDPYRTAERD